MSELTKRSILPLFDRLASELPDQDNGMLETMESLEDSISRELHRLFNTRSHLQMAGYLQGNGTVLEYGVPDFSFISGQSNTDLEQLQAVLTLAIRRYEPRLLDAAVQVHPSKDRKGLARVQIAGSARLGTEIRRIDFEMQHDASGNAGNAP